MSYTDEELNELNAKQNVRKTLQQTAESQDIDTSLKKYILDKDSYKQPIIDGLLGIEREKKPFETEDGSIHYIEFVRLDSDEDRGKWVPVHELTEEEWLKVCSNGHCNLEGARFIADHLNSLSNQNTSFSKLSEEDIKEMAKAAEIEIRNILTERMEEYDIKDLDTVEWITTVVIRPNVLMSMMQSANGGLVKEVFRNTNIVANLDEEEEEGRSWMPSQLR